MVIDLDQLSGDQSIDCVDWIVGAGQSIAHCGGYVNQVSHSEALRQLGLRLYHHTSKDEVGDPDLIVSASEE